MSGRAKPGTRVQLAAPRLAEHTPTVWVINDKAKVDGDEWTVIRDLSVLVALIDGLEIPVGASRSAVLSRLNLAGYWPTADVLNTYLRSK